jgi:hypothetical protein
VAECTNQTISNHIRCSLLQAKAPKSFWEDALRHSFHSFNSFPCKSPLGFKPPADILKHQPVDLSRLHPFGCLSWYKVPEENRKKLGSKGQAAILLSYLSNGNGFQLWDLEKCQVVKLRDVLFQDFTFPYGTKLSSTPTIIQAEIAWPPPSCAATPTPINDLANQTGQLWTPTPNLPLLDIQLEPRFDY